MKYKSEGFDQHNRNDVKDDKSNSNVDKLLF